MATRATIRDLAQIHADQDSGDFPTLTQFNTLINAAANDVWMDLYRAGWPINFTTTTIIPTGATVYALGVSNVLSVRGVYYIQGSERYELKRINEGYRAQLQSATS